MKARVLILLGMMIFGMIGISSAASPTVTVHSPTNLSYSTSNNMVVIYNVTGDVSVYNCSIDFNYTNYNISIGVSNNTVITATLNNVVELLNASLNVSCTNPTGTTTVEYNITTDFTPPNAFSLVTNATNNRVNNISSLINISIEFVETYINNITASANYTYSNSFTLAASGNASLKINWTDLGCSLLASSCLVRVKTTDLAGSNDWDSITLYINATVPTISAISWSDTDLISNSTNNYEFSLTYVASWLTNISISNITGNGSISMSCSAGSCTLTDNLSEYGCATDGACVINATLVDIFGIIAETNMTIIIDDTTPVINSTLLTNYTANFSEYGDTVLFYDFNVSDSNILMCYLEDNNMTNGTTIVNTQAWNYTSSNIKDCSGNCTHCIIEGYCIDKADNRVNFEHGITILPCLDTTDAIISSISATKNALSITLNDSVKTTTNILMVPQSLNSTHGQCNYNVTNVQNFTIRSFTINLTYTSTNARCNISMVRSPTDTGVIEVSAHSLLSQTQPSSIPVAAIGALTIIMIFAHIIATKTST